MDPDILILNSFSLVIPAGSTAGVIGVSGSGKSTILSLLGRFYEPTSGVILLDDVEISTLNVGWLRRQFGLVAQDSPLLPGSLYHNVAIGHPRYPDSTASAISREKVEEVCRLANAHGFISRLPDRYDTELKGGGHVALSGGQRQRIAIARALIRDPRILLLDEATSLLDIQSESEVRSSLMKIRNKGMTTLIISHRISALLDVDIVVCVDGGKIVEKGTPDDLMKSESRFGSLMRAQNVMEASEKSDEVTPSVEAPTTFSKGTAERSEVELQEGNNEENPMFEPIVWLWVWKRSRPYAGLIISGWIGSLLQGLEFPLQGFFISQVISSYSLPSSVQPGVTYSNAINLLFLGALIFVSKCLQNVGFGFSSAGMIEKLRSDVFKSILGAGPSFFDVDSGSVASVHLMLANDVGWFEKIPGPYFAELMKGFIAIAVGLCVAVRYGSLSLTVTLFLAAPAVVAIGKFQDWFGSIYQTRAIEASELTTTFITTILSHRPIIHRLALEPYYIHTLAKHMSRHRRLSTNHYFASSLLGHPLREALVLVLVSAALWVGGRMLVGGFIENPQNLITVVTTLAITGVNVANIVAGTGLAALNGCGRSMGRLRGCLERGAVVKTSEKSSGPMYMEQMDVDARGVTFSYPSRPEKVLNGFSLTVAKGAKVGIVGSSGSGKSTLIKLLLRFYNPSSGEIVVNSRELSLHPIGPLRAAIAVVSQETDLFNRTFADNIAMGSAGGKCERMEIVEAAIKAKADDFIRKFKMGYEEFVGERDKELARQLVELGYRGSGEPLKREEFESRKKAAENFRLSKRLATKVLTSQGKDLTGCPFLIALAEREESNRSGKLTSIIFIRTRNAKGQEISGYIDYAHRLKTENFEPYFSRTKALTPRPSDMSFYNWETQTSTSNATPNFQVIAEYENGLLFKNKRDRKIINVDPKEAKPGDNTTRIQIATTEHIQVVIYDHLTRRKA
ncbi:GTPase-activating protein [Irineochytrium annulatum]|nr:GTPase-activating protein [Irineochytrium annulatum]